METMYLTKNRIAKSSRATTSIRITIFLLVAVMSLPLVWILLSWMTINVEHWQHILDTLFQEFFWNTLQLVVFVGVGVFVLGVSLAWFTTCCEFPGRKWLEWALVLPIAMPAYVLAFVALGFFDYGGPLQSWLGKNATMIPDIRNGLGVSLVLTFVFFPYVYMLARSSFLMQGLSHYETARSLGLNPWKAFFKVVLPTNRPAIFAGLSLVMMETLADFGAVSIFNYNTFTTAIYKTWFDLRSLSTAAQISSILLLFVFVMLVSEQYSRKKIRFFQNKDTSQHRQRISLNVRQKWLVSFFAFSVFLISFLLPLLQLSLWSFSSLVTVGIEYIAYFWHTFVLGFSAAVLIVGISFFVVFMKYFYQDHWLHKVTFIMRLGYAIPGSVLAIGVMLSLNFVAKYSLNPLYETMGWTVFLLSASVIALLFAYMVRFFFVAFGPLETCFEKITPSLKDAARNLGCHQKQMIYRIYLPLLKPGLLTGALLVFVDVMKEMPATLLLRPSGWDTLAVKIFEFTSEGEWELAAMPAITLVILGLLPAILLIRRSAWKA